MDVAASGIRLTGVSHSFGDLVVLDEITMAIEAGEFVAIVGPSGCGKSTLLRVLTGLLRPTAGTATLDEADITGHAGRVGYLPQGESLLPWRRAIDNASLGLEASGSSRSEARYRAQLLFARLGLEGFERAWPHELSGGMRQRVAVARTFLLPQSVLALDEPFGALDALTRRTIQGWLRELWLRDRRTMLLITHDVEEALLLADRVVVMSHRPGRIARSIAVDIEESRPEGIETSGDFVALKRTLLEALMQGPQKSSAD